MRPLSRAGDAVVWTARASGRAVVGRHPPQRQPKRHNDVAACAGSAVRQTVGRRGHATDGGLGAWIVVVAHRGVDRAEAADWLVGDRATNGATSGCGLVGNSSVTRWRALVSTTYSRRLALVNGSLSL